MVRRRTGKCHSHTEVTPSLRLCRIFCATSDSIDRFLMSIHSKSRSASSARHRHPAKPGAGPGPKPTLVVLNLGRFQILPPITQMEGFLQLSPLGMRLQPCANRQATSSEISPCSATNGRRSRNSGIMSGSDGACVRPGGALAHSRGRRLRADATVAGDCRGGGQWHGRLLR
jgi:hypothetical protein